MKRIKQLTAVGAASLALALGVPTAAAAPPGWAGTAPVEVTPSEAAEDGAVDGGEVEVPETSPDDPVEVGSTTKEVGGGVWSYGYHVSNGIKVCWSDYYHPSRPHSASVKLSGRTVRKVVGAGVTAKAKAHTGRPNQRCYAYWNVY